MALKWRVRFIAFAAGGLGRCRFIPDLQIATHESRHVLPETLPREDAVKNIQRVAVLVSAFAKRDSSLLKFGVQDWLHQPYRKTLMPGFDALIAAAYEAGAFAAFLSGSGSTVLAIAAKQRAKKISRRWRKPQRNISWPEKRRC
jgi:homoserine kinase